MTPKEFKERKFSFKKNLGKYLFDLPRDQTEEEIRISNTESDFKNSINLALVAGGGLATLKSVQEIPKRITGRETLYHGTHKDYMNDIINKGLVPASQSGKKSYNTADYMSQFGDDVMKGAIQKVYTTPKIGVAKQYAKQIHHGGFAAVAEEIKKNPAVAWLGMGKGGEKNIIKMKVPTWKKEYIPEVDADVINSMIRDSAIIGEKEAKRAAKQLNKEVKVFPMVESKYIIKSPSYQKLSVNEVLQYIKSKPLRFASGVGLAAAIPISAAAAAVGSKMFIDELKNRKNKKLEIIKNASFFDELSKTTCDNFVDIIKNTAFLDELEKIAGDKKDDIYDAALFSGGLYAAKKSIPLITGRERFYHGTNSGVVEKIKEKGILSPSARGVIPEHTPVLKGRKHKSKSIVWTTPKKYLARMYAGEALSDMINPFSKANKNIITADIPTWKIKPEKINESVSLFKKVPPEYIRGSKKYISAAGGLKEYVLSNPKRFMSGVGLGAMATIVSAHSLSDILNRRKNNSSKSLKKHSSLVDNIAKIAGGDDFLAMDPVKPSMPNAAASPVSKPRLPTFNDTQIQPESSDRSYGQSYTPNGADEGQE